MDKYRITYRDENGEERQWNIIERGESDALAIFYRETGQAFSTIEMIHEGVHATKEQERETLAAIREMVAGLGPDSCLAAAFDGCFQDAADNICNDKTCSYRTRYEDVAKELESARIEIRYIKSNYLSTDTLADCIRLAEEVVKKWEAAEQKAAEDIVRHAERPESCAFQEAVKENRAAATQKLHYKSLLVALNNLAEA